CSHVISYFLLFLDNLIIEEITGFLYIKIVLVISPPTLKIIDPKKRRPSTWLDLRCLGFIKQIRIGCGLHVVRYH
ncbi:hypothetical protein, partial [Globicatella sanguinis]